MQISEVRMQNNEFVYGDRRARTSHSAFCVLTSALDSSLWLGERP